MAQAQFTPRIDRAMKAAGIVQRHEVIPVDGMDGFYQVTDTATGSGKVYLTSLDSCQCPDHIYRGKVCKHITAARAEHQALEAYATDWDGVAASQQSRCSMCGCPLESRQFYTGGHGWAFYEVCSGDASHSSRRPGSLDRLPEC